MDRKKKIDETPAFEKLERIIPDLNRLERKLLRVIEDYPDLSAHAVGNWALAIENQCRASLRCELIALYKEYPDNAIQAYAAHGSPRNVKLDFVLDASSEEQRVSA